MRRVAQLDGEVVSLAVRSGDGVVAGTDRGDVAWIDPRVFGLDERPTSLLRSAVALLGTPDRVGVTWSGEWLYLSVLVGGAAVGLAVHPAGRSHREFFRREGSAFFLPYEFLLGVGGGTVLAVDYDDQTNRLLAFGEGGEEEREVLRLGREVDGRPLAPDRELADDEAIPSVARMAFDERSRRLYLATIDPDNCDGNRVRALTLAEDGQPLGPAEPLLFLRWNPYPPDIGGLAANPFDGDAACLMFASEHELIVPIERLPEAGDWLPWAEAHRCRPGAAARRVDVRGRLGVNFDFYDREADAPNLPHHFRICWTHLTTGAQETPIVAVGPGRYLLGPFGGSLQWLDAATGENGLVHQFGANVTALAVDRETGTAFVGLADGAVHALGRGERGASAP